MKTKLRTEVSALWQLAWPVLIGQLATVGMGVVDVAMTGHLSANDLATVALGTALWTIVLVTMMGVMMSTNTLVAHEVGANAFGKIGPTVRQSLWLGVAVGLLGCLALNLSAVLFDYLDIEAIVRQKSKQFVYVISLGLPAFACYRALYGYTTSLNQTKPVMVIAIGGLLFNIGVNWLLVYGKWGLPQLGAVGCAVATSIGMWLMLVAMVVWVRRADCYRSSQPFTHWVAPHWAELRSMLKLGLPIGVTYFAEVSAFCASGLLMAKFGVVTLSAHQITLNFTSLVFMVPMSLGIALTTRVGQSMGEGNPVQARFIAWVGVGMSLLFAVLSAITMASLRQPIAEAYTTDVAIQHLTASYLMLAAIFQLSDGVQVCATSALRGYKVTKIPMMIQLFSFWLVFFPLGYILGAAPAWSPWRPAQAMGGAGFWMAFVVALTVAALLMSAYLMRVSQRRITASSPVLARH